MNKYPTLAFRPGKELDVKFRKVAKTRGLTVSEALKRAALNWIAHEN